MPKKSATTRKRRKALSPAEHPAKPKAITPPPVHQTTVCSVQQHRANESIQVPCIRIIGKWLGAANFTKGDKLTIEVGDRELLIKRQGQPR